MNERTGTAVRAVVTFSAACLTLATVGYALVETGLSVPAAPSSGNAALFEWWRPIEWQTAGYHLLAVTGFLGLVVLAAMLRRRGADGERPRIWLATSTALFATGALIAAIANLIQLGGQQAVLEASTTHVDPDILGTIGFVTDRITAALELAGYAALGAGVLALMPALGADRADRAWHASAGALGVGLLALALLTETDPSGLFDPVTAVVGLVMLPLWAWRLVVLTGGRRLPQPAAGSSTSTIAAGPSPSERRVDPR